ncbi:MAG: hypothetical protein ABEJ31_05300 [Haloarculaceae archaeon]
MSLKCSLLGHRFGDTSVEEEREEQGSEVVTTIKEVETCERCGAARVVSENKEITSLDAESDAGADGEGDTDDAADGEGDTDGAADADEVAPTVGGVTGGSHAPDIDAVEDDAEFIDNADPGPADAEAEAAAAEVADEGPAAGSAADADDAAEQEPPADDGAVILEDDEDERDPGEWPEEAEASDDEAAAPEPTATAVGTDADADAADGEDGAGADPVSGEWPDEYGYEEREGETTPTVDWPAEDEPDEDPWKPTESLTENIDTGDVEPAGSAAITVPEGEFECPECGFRTDVESSSLRAGDFCPECRRGSLEHRTEQTRKE